MQLYVQILVKMEALVWTSTLARVLLDMLVLVVKNVSIIVMYYTCMAKYRMMIGHSNYSTRTPFYDPE